MSYPSLARPLFLVVALSIPSLAQNVTNLFCQATATPLAVRTEGLAERMGDIVLNCNGGTAGFTVSGNLGVSLGVPITNRLTPGTSTDIQLTIDTGSGPVALAFNPVLTAVSTVSLNAISFTIPSSGSVVIRISNLRGSVANSPAASAIQAFLQFNGLSTVSLLNNPVVVAIPQRGLLSNASSTVIRCVGSPVPTTPGMAAFFAAGTHFESTRLTEGFNSAFEPKGATENAGTRFLISYKNIPTGVMLWVPDVVAGSDAQQPTAGGDLGEPQSGGLYVSGSHTLVLARVQGADATGNGGTPVNQVTYGPSGAFDGVTQLSTSGGSAYVVYEVMDSNDTVQENAQFPVFVGLASTGAAAGSAQESISFAPVSTDSTANSSAPIPRFIATEPPSDCQALGDCGANYYPVLSVFAQPIAFTAIAGGLALQPPGYIAVQNANAATSVLNYTVTLTYQSGSGWITLENSNPGGINGGSVRVFASAMNLGPGTYNATVTIDGGIAGSKSIPVTMVVSALPPNPTPTPTPSPAPPPPTGPGIVSVTNGGNFLPGPVVMGSLAAIQGSKFSGKNVGVTFDGIAATILNSSDTQINAVVPDGLGSKTSSQVVVTVDGTSSPAATANLAAVAPAILLNGILNQDFSRNTATSGAAVGGLVMIFVTGLPENTGTVLAKIHDRDDLVPVFAGPAPGLAGIQHVDVTVPADLPAMTTTALVCGLDASGNKVCSAAAPITLANAPGQ